MKKLSYILLITCLVSCKTETSEKLSKGTYRAMVQIDKTNSINFNFKVINEHEIQLYNADETITVNDIRYKNDSVYINMPVFTSYFVAKIDNGLLKGDFVKKDLNRIVPFTTKKITSRFDTKKDASSTISGSWETTFSPDNEKDMYIAKGVFKQNGNKVTGTFRTTTGDYRYLDGVLEGNQLKLSTFDGAHAFLFTATVTDSTLNGIFYSGNHWKEPFIAKKNNQFTLPDANTLTTIDTDKKFAFSFPNVNGNMVSLTDAKFRDKVVVVQIFGTWCPNCLDESRYYANFYKKYKNKDVEFVALAFEYVKTEKKAFQFIKKFKKDIGIEYDVLLAQFGTTNKEKAQEKLPMLNHILSYPTTIILDKKAVVRKVHTGFNGPATGQKYLDFTTEFQNFIDKLITE